ncbi:outer membrane protein assembly factor BamE [Paracoccus zhejiangensis]|uniref:Outer membrane protein assembly factor BamE n=1 Tax=Paracoccus zhejiangensis TaxID=1077935 RepID=A0A2H5EUJ8_9RHOB|nr:outer membrane protein assembly factor BamE [Paracoccus zhejiangensis]AUH62969.1 outer membrane protein assembly factor BamE [Paracoccus zhejiangensis]
MSAIRQFLILAVLAIAACAPVYRNHGYIPPENDLAQVVVGQTTVDELPGLIGRPSSQGLLTGSGWYYVGSRWRHYGPYEPDEITRQVVAVTFGETGTVANIERFGLERGRVVVLSRRVTDSGVGEISLIRQLMGNLGNFSAGQLIDE